MKGKYLLLALLLIGCKSVEKGEKVETEQLLEAPSASLEHMQELNWLVGTWVDKDRHYVTSNVISWNSSKTMLTQKFSVQNENKKQFDGQQIIAWDPARKQIRSWIFDSNGGMGESIWYRHDDSWIADTVFTMADGRRASAVHVYTKVDANTYTFASENRDIDGHMLPNIGPFTFEREK